MVSEFAMAPSRKPVGDGILPRYAARTSESDKMTFFSETEMAWA